MYTITDKLYELVVDHCGKVQYDFTRKGRVLVSVYIMRDVNVDKPDWLHSTFTTILEREDNKVDFDDTCQVLERHFQKLLLMSDKELDAYIPSN